MLREGQLATLVAATPGDASSPASPMHFQLLFPGGGTKSLDGIDSPLVKTVVGVGSVVEGDGGALHALVQTSGPNGGPLGPLYMIREDVSGGPPTVTRVTDESSVLAGAAFSQGFGAIWSRDLRVTIDSGKTWAAIPGPPAGAAGFNPDSRLEVSEVGLFVGRTVDRADVWYHDEILEGDLRVGWTTGDAFAAPPGPQSSEAIMLEDDFRLPRMHVVCTSRATGRHPAVPRDDDEMKAALERAAGKGASNGRREKFFYSTAMLELTAPDKDAPAPTAMTLRWAESRAPGAALHTWTGRAPAAPRWPGSLEAFESRGGRQAFELAYGKKYFDDSREGDLIVLTPAGQTVEHLTYDAMVEDLRVPGDPAAPIVWRSARAAFVWPKGGRARPFLSLPRASIGPLFSLAEPGRDSIGALLVGENYAVAQTFSLGAPGDPPRSPFDGWQPVNVRKVIDLDTLPTCTTETARGWSFSLEDIHFHAHVDGVDRHMPGHVDVRVTGASACIAGVTGRGKYDHDAWPWMSIDLVAGRGMAADAAKPPSERVLTCAVKEP